MTNERGFILPVTILISVLFFLVFTFQVQLYMTEKAFYHETEELMILENLMELGIEDMLRDLEGAAPPTLVTNQVIYYPNGMVTYKVQPTLTHTSTISISCITKQTRKYGAELTYNFDQHKIMTWLEFR